MFTMLKKNTKYIPSTISSDKNNKKFFIYEPYIGCTHKPTFTVEVFYYYSTNDGAFDEDRHYNRVFVYATCDSPKEAVNFALEKWEEVVRNKMSPLNKYYSLHFVRISSVYVKIKDDCWKFDNNKEE